MLGREPHRKEAAKSYHQAVELLPDLRDLDARSRRAPRMDGSRH
jgi:hypothetical protein